MTVSNSLYRTRTQRERQSLQEENKTLAHGEGRQADDWDLANDEDPLSCFPPGEPGQF